jgi:hypothetical protein
MGSKSRQRGSIPKYSYERIRLAAIAAGICEELKQYWADMYRSI